MIGACSIFAWRWWVSMWQSMPNGTCGMADTVGDPVPRPHCALSRLAGRTGVGIFHAAPCLGLARRCRPWLLALLSFGIQWLGLLVPYGLVQDWLVTTVKPLFAPATFLELAYSPLVATWRYLVPENIHLAWWRGEPWPATVDWFGLAMPAAGVDGRRDSADAAIAQPLQTISG